jgi:hypothetical protein
MMMSRRSDNGEVKQDFTASMTSRKTFVSVFLSVGRVPFEKKLNKPFVMQPNRWLTNERCHKRMMLEDINPCSKLEARNKTVVSSMKKNNRSSL